MVGRSSSRAEFAICVSCVCVFVCVSAVVVFSHPASASGSLSRNNNNCSPRNSGIPRVNVRARIPRTFLWNSIKRNGCARCNTHMGVHTHNRVRRRRRRRWRAQINDMRAPARVSVRRHAPCSCAQVCVCVCVGSARRTVRIYYICALKSRRVPART